MASRKGAGRDKPSADPRSAPRMRGPMKPDRYLEAFLQEEAVRINFIAANAGSHIEAAKVLFDLRKALSQDRDEGPRRA